MDEEPKDPLILGRPFLATAEAMIDVRNEKIDLNLGKDLKMNFDIKDIMKKPTIEGQLFHIEEMDRLVDELLEELSEGDHLRTALTKSGEDGYLHNDTLSYEKCLDVYEPVAEPYVFEDLAGLETRVIAAVGESLAQTRPTDSINKSSRVIPPRENVLDSCTTRAVPPSHHIESSIPAFDDWSELKALKADLKPLPRGQRYAFLGPNSTYPVIVNDALNSNELHALITELKKFRRAIGYSLDDIKRISPSLCTHRIHLQNESYSSIEPHRRLNPNLKEVVKKEILKVLDAGFIYPISDSTWISPVPCVPKKGGG
ncbi:hypothetical protein V5N11_034323 [Cardamine amara subsp. amara]|uniref:Reverse transcriptase domain-containing protein n=1 Tax=Cardamine amara subsp. amara TaxID=228776 RepID=A0ABD1C2A4_CARAN